MSAVCVLTPIVVGSWPMIVSAVSSVAACMGFNVAAGALSEETGETRVETEVPNSEVLAEAMEKGQSIVLDRAGVRVEVTRDERGACKLCVTGRGHSHAALRKIGEEVAGRVVQQFAYHKLVTELKQRGYEVVEEDLLADESIQVRVRLKG